MESFKLHFKKWIKMSDILASSYVHMHVCKQ